jgi:hypothetical protein
MKVKQWQPEVTTASRLLHKKAMSHKTIKVQHSVPVKPPKLFFDVAFLRGLSIIRVTKQVWQMDLWNFTFCAHLAVKDFRRMKKSPEGWLIAPIAA